MRPFPSLTPLLTVAALALTTAATSSAARDHAGSTRDAIPVAIPTGPPQNCVSIALLRESQVRSDRVIDFMTGARQAYRVTLPDACPGLGSERRFAYETSLSRLCSTDIITVLYDAPLTRGPSCGLAPFQPVTLPRR